MLDKLVKKKIRKFFYEAPNEHNVIFLHEKVYYDVKTDDFYHIDHYNAIILSTLFKLECLFVVDRFNDVLKNNHHLFYNKYKTESDKFNEKLIEYRQNFHVDAAYQCTVGMRFEIPCAGYNAYVHIKNINGLNVIKNNDKFSTDKVVWDPVHNLAITGHNKFTARCYLDELYYRDINFNLLAYGGDGITVNENNFNNIIEPLLKQYFNKYYPDFISIDYTKFKTKLLKDNLPKKFRS